MRRPTNEEVIQKYGDIRKHILSDGTLAPSWYLKLVRIPLPRPIPLAWGGVATKVWCHAEIAPELSNIFAIIAAHPEAWLSIGDYGGCFEFRRNRNNASEISRHAWGIAIDLDVKDNPNGDTNITAEQMHPFIIETFEKNGWIWGGRFRKPDPMHFEKGIM